MQFPARWITMPTWTSFVRLPKQSRRSASLWIVFSQSHHFGTQTISKQTQMGAKKPLKTTQMGTKVKKHMKTKNASSHWLGVFSSKVDAVWPGWGHASENPRLPAKLTPGQVDVFFYCFFISLAEMLMKIWWNRLHDITWYADVRWLIWYEMTWYELNSIDNVW